MTHIISTMPEMSNTPGTIFIITHIFQLTSGE